MSRSAHNRIMRAVYNGESLIEYSLPDIEETMEIIKNAKPRNIPVNIETYRIGSMLSLAMSSAVIAYSFTSSIPSMLLTSTITYFITAFSAYLYEGDYYYMTRGLDGEYYINKELRELIKRELSKELKLSSHGD